MSDFLKSQAEKNQETAARGPQDEPPEFTKEHPEHPDFEGEDTSEAEALGNFSREEMESDPAIHPSPPGPSWTPYERQGTIECVPYHEGQDMRGVSVSPEDVPLQEGGMIARNPDNHEDQWYINPEYFSKNYLPLFPKSNKPADQLTEDEQLLSRLSELEGENRALRVKVQNQQVRINKISQIGRR